MVGKHVRASIALTAIVWIASVWIAWAAPLPAAPLPGPQAPGQTASAATTHPGLVPGDLFQAAERCFACHNGMRTPAGEDVSIASDWRASMMANSSRDPYWQAAVRRETMDHPQARAEIEDECSICHMPMTTFSARAAGSTGRVFDHLPIGREDDEDAALAADGVSCTVCHQITSIRLGDPSTFTGGYVIDIAAAPTGRRIFGPFAMDAGRTRVMQSSSTFTPTESTHMQRAELCASCHTLQTHALAPGTAAGVRLPEQMPYVEWQNSDYRDAMSCQTCHMPAVPDMAVSSVLGQPRPALARHTFRGGNFFMLRMLNRFRDELGVQAPSREMDSAVQRTIDHLQRDTARVSVAGAERAGGRLEVDIEVENLAGHKLPTAYPSRRAWLHVVATDASGRTIFESGAFQPDGRIAGNDMDADPARFEPHYARIDRADQVQVYEAVMVGPQNEVTTGLLTGVRFIKDNRLLPRGFARGTAQPDIAVQGAASADPDFAGGRDRIRYSIETTGASGPVTIRAELWFQPIAYRWAENLRAYNAFEPQRFVRYYEQMAADSAVIVAQAAALVR
jgi:hypothetical protein